MRPIPGKTTSAFAVLCVSLVSTWSINETLAQGLPLPIGGADQELESVDGLPVPIAPQPITIIDPAIASWNEAGTGNGQPGTVVRSNWVMLGQGGGVTGTVLGETGSHTAEMKIFLLRDGFTVSQTAADASGRFKLEGLSAGLYTLVGYSPSAIFAFGFNAVNHRDACPNMPKQITTRAIATAGNKVVVSGLISKHSPEVRFPLHGQYSFDEADMGESAHFGLQGLSQFDVPAIPATTIDAQTIALENGDRFTGRVHQVHNLNGRPVPILQTKIMLLESGVVVDSTTCDRFGIFGFSAIPPGDYGLVAVGNDGFAAMGIRLVRTNSVSQTGQQSPARLESNPAKFPSQTVSLVRQLDSQNAGPPLDLTLIQPESIGWINHFVTEQQYKENISQPRMDRHYQDPGYGFPGHCGSCFRVNYGPAPSCSCHR